MTTLGGEMLSLADIAKRTDPDGMPAMIAETLHQTNPILDDIPWQASNLPTGHQSTIRTGLPTVSLRRLNEGVASSKSTSAQITDGMSLLEAWSTTDEKLLDLSPNKAQTRMQEGEAFIEAMGQKMAELLFYGDATEDEKEFNGIEPRYPLSTGTAGDNILLSGGTTAAEQTSIYLVGWAPNKVFGIYPKGSVGGLHHKDHGLQVIQDPAGTGLGSEKMSGYVDQWCWDAGLVVKDWRYICRIANIEGDDLDGTGFQQTADIDTYIGYQMVRAMNRIPNLSACRPVFYMTRSVMELWDVSNTFLANSNITRTTDAFGNNVTNFRGIPMKVCDQIIHTEAVIS